ncbi:hypothetical protein [Lactococcus allomyrinae]|uniref:Uncharacterized protein n=1 Tax=Lactococcus allomyrinae TaxID=2419773 RepID=A0A387BJV9_9LACT|nr:hypothetical protein [Lactococcus allomyrinae]AYG01240.1 hypothetical protein D7I46_09100 [Lactococcus allomyrinae]
MKQIQKNISLVTLSVFYLFALFLPYLRPIHPIIAVSGKIKDSVERHNNTTVFNHLLFHVGALSIFIALFILYFVMRNRTKKLSYIIGGALALSAFYLGGGYLFENLSQGLLGFEVIKLMFSDMLYWGYYVFAIVNLLLIAWIIRDITRNRRNHALR